MELPADLRLKMLTFFLGRTRLKDGLAILVLVDETQSQILPSTSHAMVISASVDFSRLFAGRASTGQYDYVFGLYKPFDDGDDDYSTSTTATEETNSD